MHDPEPLLQKEQCDCVPHHRIGGKKHVWHARGGRCLGREKRNTYSSMHRQVLPEHESGMFFSNNNCLLVERKQQCTSFYFLTDFPSLHGSQYSPPSAIRSSARHVERNVKEDTWDPRSWASYFQRLEQSPAGISSSYLPIPQRFGEARRERLRPCAEGPRGAQSSRGLTAKRLD